MGLLTLLVLIALVWFVVYVLKSLIPMEEPGKKALTLVALVATVFLCLWAFGVLPDLNVPLPRLR